MKVLKTSIVALTVLLSPVVVNAADVKINVTDGVVLKIFQPNPWIVSADHGSNGHYPNQLRFSIDINSDGLTDASATLATNVSSIEELVDYFQRGGYHYQIKVDKNPYTQKFNETLFSGNWLDNWDWETDGNNLYITNSTGNYSNQWEFVEGNGSTEPFDPVAPVPLPGAVWMFLAGFGALFAARKTQ